MGIKTTIKKIKRNLNDFGVRATFRKSLRYLFKDFYMKTNYRIYRRDLRAESFPEHRPNRFVLGVVENNDILALRQIVDMEEWLEDNLQNILSRGFCVAAFDGRRVVGFNLVAFREIFIPPINLNMRFLPHQAWLVQITVLKTYRRQGLATALSYRVFTELQKRGVRTLYSGVMVSNTPSRRSHEKVGFRIIADVHYLRFLNRERRIWKRARHVGRAVEQYRRAS